MKLQRAIDLLSEIHSEATAERAEALSVALDILEEERDRRARDLGRAEKHLRLVLDSAQGVERYQTWTFLRGKLTLPSETLDELERRLDLRRHPRES